VDGKRIDGSTKGGRSRVVGIDQGTMQVLEKHRLAQEADRSLAGPEWVVSDLLFTSQLGQVIHPDTFTWLMHKLITAHNEPKTPARRNHPSELLPPPARELPLIRLHDLRHLHATLLLLEGVPVHVVANRLGHTDPSVTLRVYAHVLRESSSGVADIFARAVGRSAVSKSVSRTGPEDNETRRSSL
jgi:integrase